jgi:cell division protein FtsB
MAHENKDEEVSEASPKTKPKWTLTLVVALSITVGVLLTLLIGGAIYHSRSAAAQTNELTANKEEIKHKTQQLAEMQEQIVGLSQQIHALKEYAVAKASAAAEGAAETGEKAAEKTP